MQKYLGIKSSKSKCFDTFFSRLAEEQNGDDITTIDKIKNLITIAKKQVRILTTSLSPK